MRRLLRHPRYFAQLWRTSGSAFKITIVLQALFLAWNAAGPFYHRSHTETTVIVVAFAVVTAFGWWRMKRQTDHDWEKIRDAQQISDMITHSQTRSMHDWPPHLQEEMAVIRAHVILADKDAR